jgi:GNAT superfamily N-acetyltransferase
MRRALPGGFELDDDPTRIDVGLVHRFLSTEAYWALGRSREEVEATLARSSRVVGLYGGDGGQLGFARVISDGRVIAYLADVFVLPEARGRGLGVELVREAVERGPQAGCRWMLHTLDAHGLYTRFGFAPPSARVLERPRPSS